MQTELETPTAIVTRIIDSAQELVQSRGYNAFSFRDRGGIEISGVRQLLYFHPRYMKIVVETAPDAVIEAPLKFVVRETPVGTECNTHLPSQTFGRYGGLEAMARELDAVVAGIAGAL